MTSVNIFKNLRPEDRNQVIKEADQYLQGKIENLEKKISELKNTVTYIPIDNSLQATQKINNNPPDIHKMLSVKEASYLLGYKESYVYQLVKEGKLPYSKPPNGRRIFFERAKVESWLIKVPVKDEAEPVKVISEYKLKQEINKNKLSFNEAAEFLGYKKNYLYQLTSKRKIPFSKPTNGKIFFDRKKLEDWVLGSKEENTKAKKEHNLKEIIFSTVVNAMKLNKHSESYISEPSKEQNNTVKIMDLQDKKILPFEEGCKLLGYSKSSVYKLIAAGKLPYSKPNGKSIFFERAKLEAWMLGTPEKYEADITEYKLLSTFFKRAKKERLVITAFKQLASKWEMFEFASLLRDIEKELPKDEAENQ